MAKKFVQPEKNTGPKFPSEFGSHVSMVDEAATALLEDAKLVVCVDEHGPYITERKRLDNKSADPNRYSGRVKKEIPVIESENA